ncbi:hypothetical protein [Cohnella panacarvi]|uniref:hypothetical protein n=1 Tax=Cohnella panacarvi TaxID=400776 RepID=UPI00047EBD3F|nr:hypothetical protein [Cohnella panacarvi]
MKKIVIGILIGAALAFSGQALAETTSKVGKTIQTEYTVVVDGDPLKMKAIAVDGSSYTPNRVLAEAVGYNVDFKDNTVILTKKEDDIMSDVVTIPEQTVPEQSGNDPAVTGISLEGIEAGLKSLNSLLDFAKNSLERATTEEGKEKMKKKIEDITAQIESLNEMKDQLESQQPKQ